MWHQGSDCIKVRVTPHLIQSEGKLRNLGQKRAEVGSAYRDRESVTGSKIRAPLVLE